MIYYLEAQASLGSRLGVFEPMDNINLEFIAMLIMN
jgi:hypothetical protein